MRHKAGACPNFSTDPEVSDIHRHYHYFQGFNQLSKWRSTLLIVSVVRPAMSVKFSQRVISRALPSTSRMYSSTSTIFSAFLRRRCCLQSSAVCLCRFLVPTLISCTWEIDQSKFVWHLLWINRNVCFDKFPPRSHICFVLTGVCLLTGLNRKFEGLYVVQNVRTCECLQ